MLASFKPFVNAFLYMLVIILIEFSIILIDFSDQFNIYIY